MSTSCSHPKVFLSLHVEEGAAVCSKEGPQDLLSHLFLGDGVPGDGLLAWNLVVSRGEREMIRGRGSN